MRNKRIKKNIRVALYLLPTFFFLFLFTYFPYIASFIDSFSHRRGNRLSFVGLQNYEQLFTDGVLHHVILNNFVYSALTVPLTMVFALALAILLNRKISASAFYKTAFFYPTVIPMAAASMIWLYLLLPTYGVINRILMTIGFRSIEWVGDPTYAMISIVIVGIWKNVGYYMMIFLTGLQAIPRSLLESAHLDGAGPVMKFRKIVLPMISSTSFFILIIAVINSFQAVEQVYLMTRGGPGNATNLIVYFIYQNAFSFWNFNYASTLTVFLVTLLLAITLFFFKVIEPRVYYESGE
jgi:sn-glycerol 3-phosphate transport system permease protein